MKKVNKIWYLILSVSWLAILVLIVVLIKNGKELSLWQSVVPISYIVIHNLLQFISGFEKIDKAIKFLKNTEEKLKE